MGPGHPPGGLRFRPRQSDKALEIGLGLQSRAPADYSKIDFAVYLHDGTLDVHETGLTAFSSPKKYSAKSLIELRVFEEKVEVWLDGEKLDYSGTLLGPSTLYAMADFEEVGAEVVDIRWL